MSIEQSHDPRTPEIPNQSDLELAGSLQAVLLDIENRDFSLDLQQSEALEAIGHALVEGVPAGYVEMATSTGKTTVEALLAEAAVKAGKRVLLLAPTIQIAKQIEGSTTAHSTGLSRFAHIPEGTLQEAHFGKAKGSTSADIVVSTYAGFLNNVKNGHAQLGEFDIIIADECHRSLGKETSEALRTSMPNAFKLGLSATPDYAVNRKSEEVYERCLYEFSLLDAVESGKTAPVRTMLYETDESLVLSDPRREFTDRELAPLIHNLQRNGTAVALVQALVQEGRQGIVACIPGEMNLHARLMADLLKKSGVRAVDIGAHLDTDTVARRLALYHTGGIDVLTFTRALEEGWDSNRASFALNLTPTSSPVRTTQLLGRILRKKPDDMDSIFVDFVDNKSGNRNKSQFTALHALGLEAIDFTRVLGRSNGESSNRDNHALKLLHTISPKVYKRLLESQGRLLSEIAVGETPDPLQKEWERILEKEGFPAELHHNDALPPKLAERVTKAYRKFYYDNGVVPSVDELIEQMGTVTGPEKTILGSYALRSELDQLDELDILDHVDDRESMNPHYILTDKLFRKTVNDMLETLSEREAGIVSGVFGLALDDPMTLDQLGMKYGITRERVRQIEAKTMAKVRHPSRSKTLKDAYFDTEPKIAPDTSESKTKTSRVLTGNPFLDQFKKFAPPVPLLPVELQQKLLPTYVKIVYPHARDDSDRKPFHWESVVQARVRLGIIFPTYKEFSAKERQLDEAIASVGRVISRLEDLPISEHVSSLDQRIETLDIYQQRLEYLEKQRDQLEELYQFLETHHALANE